MTTATDKPTDPESQIRFSWRKYEVPMQRSEVLSLLKQFAFFFFGRLRKAYEVGCGSTFEIPMRSMHRSLPSQRAQLWPIILLQLLIPMRTHRVQSFGLSSSHMIFLKPQRVSRRHQANRPAGRPKSDTGGGGGGGNNSP